MIKETQVGRRYAEAIFEIAESNDKVIEIYEALNSLMEAYKTDIDFKNFVDHPLIDIAEKKEVLGTIYKDESEEIRNIIFYLLDKHRMGNIREIDRKSTRLNSSH